MSSEPGDDDPQLKSLRAVWLSLPDEDPPERGLAELMAAARIKAEQMTKPSLWQRIIAQLRRPPVFALATVLILIGGVVFLGQRRDKMEAEPTATYERAQDTAVATGSAAVATPPQAMPADDPGEDRGAPAGNAAEVPSMIEDKPIDTATEKATPPEPTRKPARKAPTSSAPASPSIPRPTAPRTSAAGADGARFGDTKVEKESLHGTGGGGGAGVVGGGGGAGVVGGTTADDRGLREEQTATDSFASPPPEAAPEPAKPTSAAPSKSATKPPARAPQYIAQARSAAARGDCAAARMLMKRVKSEDAAEYRKALASDAALNKCVVAAQ